MITYSFQLDKEACFANWVQALVKWGWYFSKKEYEYNTKVPFTEMESAALQRLKNLLGRDDTGFVFLWDRYQGNLIKNNNDRKDWEYIQKVFQERFEKLWNRESPKLHAWAEKLNSYQFNDERDVLKKTLSFLGLFSNFKRVINVKLLFNYSDEHLSGHTKRGLENLFIFKISGLRHEHLDKLLDILLHETIHILEHNSPIFEDLIRNAHLSIVKSLNIERHNPDWRHLLYESFTSSIVGHGLRMGKEINKQPFVDEYLNEIRAVALRLAPLTQEYMKQGRAMDEAYADALAQEWKRIGAQGILG